MLDVKTVLIIFFFFSSRRRHTRFDCDWSSDVCSSDLSRLREFPRLLRQNPGGVSGEAARFGRRCTHYQETSAEITGQSERQDRRARRPNSYFECEIDRARCETGESCRVESEKEQESLAARLWKTNFIAITKSGLCRRCKNCTATKTFTKFRRLRRWLLTPRSARNRM